MGLEDRQYYRDQQDWGRQWQPGGQQRGTSVISSSIVVTLIVINVAIAILDLFTPAMPGGGHWLSDHLALTTEVLQKPWLGYTFLTYGFAHSPLDGDGMWHIVGNMAVLFFLGRWVEYRLGYWEFLRFYLVSIVLAGVAFVLMRIAGDPSSCIGASGAVSAVLMLFVFMYPKQTVLLFFVLPIPAWVLGAFVVVSDIMTSLRPESVIAYEAHLAGLAFGAAYAYFGWNLRWMRFERLGSLFKSKPRLKVHSPGVDSQLQSQADQILKKIADQGEASLTPKERRLLNRYSKQIRNRRD